MINDSGMRHGCFRGQQACMAGLATSGTLTHWFADQFARELDRAVRDGGARRRSRGVAAGRATAL